MGKYGQAAIDAVRMYQRMESASPVDAWEVATKNLFGEGTWGQRKGCPKSSFLGLCEEGLVKGIPSGKYIRSQKNKMYAIKAVHLLKNDPTLAENPSVLWKLVINGKPISHNHQLDVVISLWKSDFLAV